MSEIILDTSKNAEWSLKSKWHHILFWSVNTIFWMAVSWEGPIMSNILINIVFLFFNALAVYSILYYLMPKYLYKQKYILFVCLFICILCFCAFLLGLSLYAVHNLRGISHEDFFSFPSILGPTLGSISTTVFIFMIAKLAKNNILSEKKNENLELEKTENELKFLKSQLNPHFLFNALNNIYFLIKRDPDIASESLAKFSDMMRYQLYECNEDKILLNQELDYINNYIKISSLGKSETTEIRVDIIESANGIMVSPLILIPLVENAFKHIGENTSGENYIDIKISLKTDTLECTVKNSVDKSKGSETKEVIYMQKGGGLGLQNLKRRLTLLYPKNHILETNESVNNYTSYLKLQL